MALAGAWVMHKQEHGGEAGVESGVGHEQKQKLGRSRSRSEEGEGAVVKQEQEHRKQEYRQ